ncbi:MAG TPA: hypothetical protein VI076_02275 [Actinopolymorphaceae bacterium]
MVERETSRDQRFVQIIDLEVDGNDLYAAMATSVDILRDLLFDRTVDRQMFLLATRPQCDRYEFPVTPRTDTENRVEKRYFG